MSARVFAKRESDDGVYTHVFDIMTDHKLLMFTDLGNCFTFRRNRFLNVDCGIVGCPM
jgi:hypothetical protein